MRYIMTAKNNSTIGYWEPRRAKTERGAKREATRELDGGYTDDTLYIGIDHGNGNIQAIARKDADGWVNIY